MDRREALITAGRTRLRPIMMTTLAMIFGMLPLALGIGAGAEMRAPMARAVIGGLITSTVLTLLVVPVVYTLFDDFGGWLHRRWAKANALEQDAHARGRRRSAAGAAARRLRWPCRRRAEEPAAAAPPAAAPRRARADPGGRGPARHARRTATWPRRAPTRSGCRGKYVEERAAALPFARRPGRRCDLLGRRHPAARPATSSPSSTTAEGRSASPLSQALFTWGKVGAAIRAARLGHRRRRRPAGRLPAGGGARRDRGLLRRALRPRAARRSPARPWRSGERQLAEAEQRNALGTATDYDVLAARVALENQRPEVIRAGGPGRRWRLDRLRLVLAEESSRPRRQPGRLEAEPAAGPAARRGASGPRSTAGPTCAAWGARSRCGARSCASLNADDKPRLDLAAGAGWRWLDTGPGGAESSGNGRTWTRPWSSPSPSSTAWPPAAGCSRPRATWRGAELDLAQARDGACGRGARRARAGAGGGARSCGRSPARSSRRGGSWRWPRRGRTWA